jgi:hypothetical protein
MVYIFDPKWFNGTIFLLDEDTWHMSRGWTEHVRANQPIPASFFPKLLTITRASAVLPDLFHASRGIIAVSDRARVVLEELAPGQVEFIPVKLNAAPTTWRNSLADAYYSVRDLGRESLRVDTEPFHRCRMYAMAVLAFIERRNVGGDQLALSRRLLGRLAHHLAAQIYKSPAGLFIVIVWRTRHQG